MTTLEIINLITSILVIIFLIERIIEKSLSLKKIISIKPDLKIKIPILGSSFVWRTEEETKKFGLPKVQPIFFLDLEIINNSKKRNILDINIYFKKKQFYLKSIRNLKIEPMELKELNLEMKFLLSSERRLWENSKWEDIKDDSKKLQKLFYSLLPTPLFIEINDVYNKKLIIKDSFKFD